jgi:tRNA A-37 threonylcarbamoyl transferase component Bud32
VGLSPGESFGPYTVLGPVGRGGMASVWKCHEKALDRAIALKVLPKEFLHDEAFAERFRREATFIAKLEHPNIVPIHAYGIQEDADGRTPWMAMRFIAGGSLSGLLKQRRLEHREVVSILRGVADALDYAHSQGFVHRDVKPQNVLLDDAGRVYLADFGIAKMMESSSPLTQSGMITGTPQYMAPEQAKGGAIDHRADIYALGVVAYEMLTGRTPFSADTPVAVLLKHVTEAVPRPSAGDVPEAATEALLRSLAKEPGDRWPSACAFVDALEQGLLAAPAIPTWSAASTVGGTITTHRTAAPPVPPPPPRIAKRPPAPAVAAASPIHRAAIALGGLAVLVFLVAAGYYVAHQPGGAPALAESPGASPSSVPAASSAPAVASPAAVSAVTSVATSVPAVPSSAAGARPTQATTPAQAPAIASQAVGRPADRTSAPVAAPVATPAVDAPVPVPTPSLGPAVAAPTPATPVTLAGPGGSLEGLIDFSPGTVLPLEIRSGALRASTVKLQVTDGRAGRFKRLIKKGGDIATVHAAFEVLRPAKAGDWNLVLTLELLDESGRSMAVFGDHVGIEDDRTVVTLEHEMTKGELQLVRRAKVRFEATPD